MQVLADRMTDSRWPLPRSTASGNTLDSARQITLSPSSSQARCRALKGGAPNLQLPSSAMTTGPGHRKQDRE
jgi:hypothetical protein